MKVKLKNATAHTITLTLSNGVPIEIPASGIITRCVEQIKVTGYVEVEQGSVPVLSRVFGQLINPPPQEDGVIWIASSVAAQAAWLQGRKDILALQLRRGPQGEILGAYALLAPPLWLGGQTSPWYNPFEQGGGP